PPRPELPSHPDDGPGQRPWLLPLSASSREALRELAGSCASLLTESAEPATHDVCYTASVRRAHLPHRLAVTGRTRAELAERLAAFAAEGEAAAGTGLVVDRVPASGEGRRLAFVFSGHGSYWRGMGQRLLRE